MNFNWPQLAPKPAHGDIFSRLMEIRLAWKLSLPDVAERLDITPGTLRKWELGITVPSLDGLVRWASVLGYQLSLWPKEQTR